MYICVFSGTSDSSRQSSTSTTPSVSPTPSPRNSVSHLAKPSSPASHMNKTTLGGQGSSQISKPAGVKSSVPRANGPSTIVTAAQSQAVRRTKAAGDRFV